MIVSVITWSLAIVKLKPSLIGKTFLNNMILYLFLEKVGGKMFLYASKTTIKHNLG